MEKEEATLDEMRLRAMKKIVRAAHRKGIDTFVGIGASSKPVSLLFKHVWKALYPNEVPPKMVSLGKFIERDKILDLFSNPKIVQKLFEHRPLLRERIKGKIILFDGLSINGSTLRLVKRIFQKAGARNVTTAVLFSTRKRGKPFFPQEGFSVSLRKVADIVGEVNNSLMLVQKAAYYKKRALVRHNPFESNPRKSQKAASLKLKTIRAHLRPLGKRATKRKRR